ncbi:MAG: SIS domain-containing protein [Alkalispirochaeta sp.]
MNSEQRYTQYALCREMLETPTVIRRFDADAATALAVKGSTTILTGEGSSRIFPAKRVVAQALRQGWKERFVVDGANQVGEYNLDDAHLFVVSNSGRTAEGVRLLRTANPAGSTGIVANGGTPIVDAAEESFVLGCGPEEAVAATKSVVEQGLVYDALFRHRNGADAIDRERLAEAFGSVLELPVPGTFVEAAVRAPVIFFAGRNDGVAEELTLKTNEITRKRSDFLEGTYAVHGIEEVMDPNDVVVLIDPFPVEEEKFATVLEKGVGVTVIAVASRETRFPTIRIPDLGESTTYLQLAAGWNLLVEIGLALGIDLDTPARARKVGNEFTQ